MPKLLFFGEPSGCGTERSNEMLFNTGHNGNEKGVINLLDTTENYFYCSNGICNFNSDKRKFKFK